jgi:hypothetical protein
MDDCLSLVIAPWIVVEVYRRFGGTCCFHLQGDDSNIALKIGTENTSGRRWSTRVHRATTQKTVIFIRIMHFLTSVVGLLTFHFLRVSECQYKHCNDSRWSVSVLEVKPNTINSLLLPLLDAKSAQGPRTCLGVIIIIIIMYCCGYTYRITIKPTVIRMFPIPYKQDYIKFTRTNSHPRLF